MLYFFHISKGYNICVILFILVIYNIAKDDFDFRILKGEITSTSAYPYIARIDDQNGNYKCTGTIIHDRVVLTAAKCTHTNDIRVVVNVTTISERGIELKILKIIEHPNFIHHNGILDDLALIILKEKVPETSDIIDIALTDIAYKDLPYQATILGWGCSNCNYLILDINCKSIEVSRYLRIATVNLDRRYSNKRYSTSSSSKVKACGNDAGGPVLVDDELLAIISHLQDKQNFYMSVPGNLPWIQDTLRNANIHFKLE